MSRTVTLIDAHQPEHLGAVRALFNEYAASLGFSLCFQSFDAELAGLPGKYAPPEGRLVLALVDGRPEACAAIRPLEPGICELKRMYVRPAFRGLGIARALALHLVDAARTIGYARMRLDTLKTMTAANALYESMGFVDIAPYCHNPLAEARYMELVFTPQP